MLKAGPKQGPTSTDASIKIQSIQLYAQMTQRKGKQGPTPKKHTTSLSGDISGALPKTAGKPTTVTCHAAMTTTDLSAGMLQLIILCNGQQVQNLIAHSLDSGSLEVTVTQLQKSMKEIVQELDNLKRERGGRRPPQYNQHWWDQDKQRDQRRREAHSPHLTSNPKRKRV